MPAGAGIDDGGIEVGGAEVEVGAEEGAVVDASDGPLALALRVWKSDHGIIQVPTVLLYICQINGRAEGLKG